MSIRVRKYESSPAIVVPWMASRPRVPGLLPEAASAGRLILMNYMVIQYRRP